MKRLPGRHLIGGDDDEIAAQADLLLSYAHTFFWIKEHSALLILVHVKIFLECLPETDLLVHMFREVCFHFSKFFLKLRTFYHLLRYAVIDMEITFFFIGIHVFNVLPAEIAPIKEKPYLFVSVSCGFFKLTHQMTLRTAWMLRFFKFATFTS